VSSAKPDENIMEQILRNIVQMVNMNKFSSNIFPSAPQFLRKCVQMMSSAQQMMSSAQQMMSSGQVWG
jgi:hypothetical protein